MRKEGLTEDSYEQLSDVDIIGHGEVPQWMDPTLKEVYLENKAAFDAMASEVAEEDETAEETKGALFRFSKTPEEFDAIQKLAKENKGVVMPNLRDRTLNIVDVPKHWFTGNLKNARAEARKWATEEYVGKDFPLPDGEGNYTISSNAIKKYIDNSSIGQSDNPSVHLSVLTSLPRIIEESIDTEIHADYKKIDNSRKAEYGINKEDLLVHRLYGAVDIEGKLYRVKITMYEFRKGNNSPHNYEVTKIELIEDPTASQTNEFSRPLSASTNSISVAKLLDGVVKSYDGSKKVLDESDNSPLTDTNCKLRITIRTKTPKTKKDATLRVMELKVC